jgi:hypothetical protein
VTITGFPAGPALVAIRVRQLSLDGTLTAGYVRFMCDLSQDEQGALIGLLGNLQAAEARLAATYPEVFTRAWADHEAMLASLDELTSAAGRVREWVAAKHHATM